MSSPFPPGSTIIGYTRDSGGDRQDLSTERQQTTLSQWAVEHGHPITFYTDQAAPGSSTVGRQNFLRMIRHFRNGATEAGIVLWSYKRFARSIDDAQFFKADIRRRGYIIHSLTDPVPEGAMGRFVEFAYDWQADQFLENLSTEVKDGLEKIVREYGAVPGTPPRGFKRQPVHLPDRRDGTPHTLHRWVPDEKLVPLVKRAFAMRAAGATLQQIQHETQLYKAQNSYKTFFANRIYIGELHYGSLVVPAYCQPIIDPQTWATVQEILQRHRLQQHLAPNSPHHPRRRQSSYLLSGLLRCARCGSPFSGHSAKQRNGKYYRSYQCTQAKRRRDCDQKRISAAKLEQAVLSAVIEQILQPDGLQTLHAHYLAQAAGQHSEISAKLEAHRQQLGQSRKKLTNLAEAIAAAGHNQTLLAALTTEEQTKTILENQIATLEKQLNTPIELTPDQLQQRAQSLRSALLQTETGAQQQILRGLLQTITADRDEKTILAEIHYYYPPAELKKNTDIKSVPMGHAPLGALVYRHSIKLSLRSKRTP